MKMASQRFCLRWNNHQSNLLSVFDQLLHAETFTDVTLAVEGQYLRAHKMVLSACSPYFNALFINHPEKHPIVILKDVPYADMKSLLDFMYRGEVSVDQERLTAFLRVAESLRIKGLTEVNDEKPASNEIQPTQIQRIQPYLVQQQNKNTSSQSQTISNLSSLPKRKRGRPRKLSGSSNGTGDYDEYDHEEILNDDLEANKLNDSLSTHEDASDDYRRDSDHNENTMSRKKRNKGQRDVPSQIHQNDNSTSGEFGKHNRNLHLDVLKLNQKNENHSRASPSFEENIRGSNLSENNDYNINYKEAYLEPIEAKLTEKLSQQKMMETVLQSKIDVTSQNEEKMNDFNHININDRTVSNEKRKFPDMHFDQKGKSEEKISYTFFNLQKDTVTSPYEMLFIESKGNMDTGVKAVEMGTPTTKVLDISTKNPILRSSSSQEIITSVTRRRMRRKAQSTIDDQAEHLTEMSVRGLDLFRYASINNGVYQCTECAKGNIQKTFKNKYSFQRHAFLYHEGKHRKVFPCNICGKEFSRPDKMKNHIKMTHESSLLKELEQGREIDYLKSIVTKEGQTKAFKQRFQQENNMYQYCQEEIPSMKKSEIDVPSTNIDKHTLLGPSIISQSRTSESFVTMQHHKQN